MPLPRTRVDGLSDPRIHRTTELAPLLRAGARVRTPREAAELLEPAQPLEGVARLRPRRPDVARLDLAQLTRPHQPIPRMRDVSLAAVTARERGEPCAVTGAAISRIARELIELRRLSTRAQREDQSQQQELATRQGEGTPHGPERARKHEEASARPRRLQDEEPHEHGDNDAS